MPVIRNRHESNDFSVVTDRESAADRIPVLSAYSKFGTPARGKLPVTVQEQSQADHAGDARLWLIAKKAQH